MQLSLPPIKDPALQKFCEEHELYDTLVAAYHYAQKFFPAATNIEIDFYEPYDPDEPEDAAIDFVIETDMTVEEVLDAERRFIKATNDIPGIEYIVTSYRFVDYEPS